MARRSLSVSLLAGMLVAALLPLSVSAAEPLPASMAAVGDSISQAVSSGGSLGATYPANSWSTGTNSTVNSHYARLLALSPAISGHAYNDSVSGAKMADLDGQMRVAAGQQPQYLTVLIGGNDLCTDTVGEMTSVADFGTQFTAAMTTLTSGSPTTKVYVVSIPRVTQLWELFKGSFLARSVWSLGSICQSLLANPTSTQAADVQRRAEVAKPNEDFNAKLAEVCAQYAQCRSDGCAVHNVVFGKSDVSGDYFHPSVTGQAKLAAVSWAAGYWSGGGPTPRMHLAGTNVSATPRKGGWTASVTVSVANDSGGAVGGATVTGAWSTGGAGSCITAASGTCSLSLGMGRKTPSVTWTVSAVAASGYAYDPAANVGSPVTISAP